MLKIKSVALSLVALGLLLGASPGSCGGGESEVRGIDVGGPAGADWTITYSDIMEVNIKEHGVVVATHDISVANGGVFELDGVDIDIKDICARTDVACPSEVFPKVVRIAQPDNELEQLRMGFNKEGPLGKLTDATLLGNVDSANQFFIDLGIKAAALDRCGLLGYSHATGRILEEPGSDPLKGIEIENGWITTAYAGGCIQTGYTGDLELEIKIRFIGKRL